jgi:uncharacterized phage-associated protein
MKKNAQDIATKLLKLSIETGEALTNIKLQKLLYYCYAWFLVKTKNSKELFSNSIEAWKYGPVVPEIYHFYKSFGSDSLRIEEDKVDLSFEKRKVEFSKEEEEIISDVFFTYASKSAMELVHLTHREAPWIQAYSGSKTKKDVMNRDRIFSFFQEKKQRSEISKS